MSEFPHSITEAGLIRLQFGFSRFYPLNPLKGKWLKISASLSEG